MKEVCWYLLGDPDKVITIAEFEALLASNYWHHEYSQKDDDGDVIVQRDSYLGDIWINRIQHFKAHNAPLHPSDIENSPFSEKAEHSPYETHWNCMGNPIIVAENGKIMKGTELYSELNRCLDSTMQN